MQPGTQRQQGKDEFDDLPCIMNYYLAIQRTFYWHGLRGFYTNVDVVIYDTRYQKIHCYKKSFREDPPVHVNSIIYSCILLFD